MSFADYDDNKQPHNPTKGSTMQENQEIQSIDNDVFSGEAVLPVSCKTIVDLLNCAPEIVAEKIVSEINESEFIRVAKDKDGSYIIRTADHGESEDIKYCNDIFDIAQDELCSDFVVTNSGCTRSIH
jgi:hypothetical protein